MVDFPPVAVYVVTLGGFGSRHHFARGFERECLLGAVHGAAAQYSGKDEDGGRLKEGFGLHDVIPFKFQTAF